MEVAILHGVHFDPSAVFAIDLIVGAPNSGLFADRDVIRPGGQVLHDFRYPMNVFKVFRDHRN